jgi:hypothetical protein
MDRQDRSLEARVRRLEDRQELADLIARYGVAVDDRDGPRLLELFAPDGVFEGHSLGDSDGPDAVLGYFRERWKDYGATFHYTHTQTVEFGADPDVATGLVTGHAEIAYKGRAVWTAFRYHDDYTRVEGAWRFRGRRVRFLYAMPLDELPTHLASAERKRWPGTEPSAQDLTWGAG